MNAYEVMVQERAALCLGFVAGGSQGIGAGAVHRFLRGGATVHTAGPARTHMAEHERLHHDEAGVTVEDRRRDVVSEVPEPTERHRATGQGA